MIFIMRKPTYFFYGSQYRNQERNLKLTIPIITPLYHNAIGPAMNHG